ncbi:MAG TPA: hypothetical protein VKU84_18630, partial [Stellaceae bacterium]|nr:hypothetical protein [Stellaceae bacterium]
MSGAGGIEALAHALGIATSYWDAEGRHCVPSPETLAAIAGALGYPAQDDAAREASLALRERGQPERLLPPVLVVREDQTPIQIEIRWPQETLTAAPRWRVIEETGGVSEGEVAGERRGTLAVPCRLPIGYHRFELDVAGAQVTRVEQMPLIVVPRRAFRPDFFEHDGRCWGMAVQLYG